jgi:asparagine synthase (glutamine-hydrolysing)
MSAIAGIVRRDAAPSEARRVGAMLQALAHRAPDGLNLWSEGQAALGHGAFFTTPDARLAPAPTDDGRIVVTADVRLDNREDLEAALGQDGPPGSDSQLIAAAYRRWGVDCAEHLLGDFAFALWDRNERRLYCARDHAGVKPFYYHANPRTFAFASEIKALFAADLGRFPVAERAIAEFLAFVPAEAADTLYEGVCRLPPGHWLTASDSAVETHCYWSARARSAPSGPNYAEEFAEILTRAVKRRMRSPEPVGAMLSGGLDSSSIVTLARPIAQEQFGAPLPTLSIVFDDTPKLNERAYIESVLDLGGCDPAFLDRGGYAPLEDLDTVLTEQDGLYYAPGMIMTRALYRSATGRNLKVLLDGHGGDETVSHGVGRLMELADARDWPTLWREAGGLSRIFGQSQLGAFMSYFNQYEPQRSLATYWMRGRRKLAHLLGDKTAGQGKAQWSAMLNPQLVERSGLAERRRRMMTPAMTARTEQDSQRAILSSTLQSTAFETLDRVAASSGVELRYPFWDKDLVEFCLGLPSQEKINRGWTRSILRRSMEGLPEMVRWRTSKFDFSAHIAAGIVSHHREMVEDILLGDGGELAGYVDVPAVAAAYARLAVAGGNAAGEDLQIVWRTVVLGHWLRTQNAL